MPKPKVSRFKNREYADIEGFQFARYDSLLARESFRLLELRKEIFSSVKGMLSLVADIEQELDLSNVEAWHVLQNRGVTTDGIDHQAAMVPYFLQFAKMQDSEQQQQNFMRQSVVTILSHRLEPKWLAANLEDLVAAFPLDLTVEDIEKFAAVAPSDRLIDADALYVAREIASSIPEYIFNAIVAFIGQEQNYGVPVPASEDEEAAATDTKV